MHPAGHVDVPVGKRGRGAGPDGVLLKRLEGFPVGRVHAVFPARAPFQESLRVPAGDSADAPVCLKRFAYRAIEQNAVAHILHEHPVADL